MPFKPLVFVSYARHDKNHLEALAGRLGELADQGAITTFIDRDLQAGDDWRRRILRALGQFDIAIILISKNLLASKFIREVELPAIQHAARNYRAKIIPLFLEDCDVADLVWLLAHQLPAEGKKSFLAMEPGDRARILDEIVDSIGLFALRESHSRRILRRNILNWRFSVPFSLITATLLVTAFFLGWRQMQPSLVRSIAWTAPLSACKAESEGSAVQLFERGWMVARFESDEFLAIIKNVGDRVTWQRFDTAGFTKGLRYKCPSDNSSKLLRLGFRWRYCHRDSADLRAALGRPLTAETRSWMQYQTWWEGHLLYGLPSTKQGIESLHFQKISGVMLRDYSKESGTGSIFGSTGSNSKQSAYCTAMWYPARKDRRRTQLHENIANSANCPNVVDADHYIVPRTVCSLSGY